MTTRSFTLKNVSLAVSIKNIERWGVKDSNGEYVNNGKPGYNTYHEAERLIDSLDPTMRYSIIPVMGLESGIGIEELHLVHDEIEDSLFQEYGKTVASMLYGPVRGKMVDVYRAVEIVNMSIDTTNRATGYNGYVTLNIESVTFEAKSER